MLAGRQAAPAKLGYRKLSNEGIHSCTCLSSDPAAGRSGSAPRAASTAGRRPITAGLATSGVGATPWSGRSRYPNRLTTRSCRFQQQGGAASSPVFWSSH